MEIKAVVLAAGQGTADEVQPAKSASPDFGKTIGLV